MIKLWVLNTSYHLLDHLGSITVSTDTKGAVTELNDYFPYGSMRIDETSSPQGSKEQRKYIGQEFDVSTGLSYLNARYYDGNRGQFLSQDPVFNEDPNEQNLLNPQSLNSYSYANGNPIVNKDPDGRSAAGVPLTPLEFVLFALLSPIQGSYDTVYESEQYATQDSPTNSIVNAAMNMAGPGGGSRIAGRLIKATDRVVDAAKFLKGADKINDTARNSIKFATGKVGDSLKNAQQHWVKHQSDFPQFKNEFDYANYADKFVNSPSKNAMVKNLQGGRTAIYEPSTNTLGFKQNGTPTSLYKPDPSVHGRKTNLDYFKSLK